jgi:predicted DNA-binding protein
LKAFRHCSVRVPRDLFDRIDAEAASLGCTPSDVIRRAIEVHIERTKLLTDSSRRHLRVTEYMQVALDAIIRENHPELRETLVLETDRRMKLHHGA